MIDVKFERLNIDMTLCDGCLTEIRETQPHFAIDLDMIGRLIHLCEDCGNNLQNNMSDEYCKFVDLGL